MEASEQVKAFQDAAREREVGLGAVGSFSRALEAIKQGQRVRRACWDDKRCVWREYEEHRYQIMEAGLFRGDENRRWEPTSDDLLADDWMLLGGPYVR